MFKLSLLKDFSKTPGPRSKTEGDFSGEEFRDLLISRMKESIQEDETLVLDLDGTAGINHPFIEGAFKGLVTKEIFTLKQLQDTLHIVSDEDTELINFIWDMMQLENDFGV